MRAQWACKSRSRLLWRSVVALTASFRVVVSSHVRVVCLPTRDTAFADHVDAVMAQLPDVTEPAALEGALRPEYPSVIVRPSVLEGLRTPTWYVYRDGSFPWPDG